MPLRCEREHADIHSDTITADPPRTWGEPIPMKPIVQISLDLTSIDEAIETAEMALALASIG